MDIDVCISSTCAFLTDKWILMYVFLVPVPSLTDKWILMYVLIVPVPL